MSTAAQSEISESADEADSAGNDSPDEPASSGSASIYNAVFWMAYVANTALVAANALTFRFAELVAWRGGTEQIAGTIVSIGVLGALISRLFLGQAIDRFGVRRLWMLASVVFMIGCVGTVAAPAIDWMMTAARIAFATSLAAMFTCSIVHIQNLVPTERRTEIIGILGSSGFLGMIIGTQAGDAIYNGFAAPDNFWIMFGGSASLGAIYLLLVMLLTRGMEPHARPMATPPVHRLVFRFWPGSVVLVALMMGMNFTVASIFLTRFATSRNIAGIGTYWTVYAIAAFAFRVGTRRWSRTVGRHRMILRGLTGQALGNCLMPFVTQDYHFIGPALLSGFGHALLFPAVVSLGSGAFPKRYRGTGTTMVLGFFDFGAFLTAPLLGAIIDHLESGFSWMFALVAISALAVATIFHLTNDQKKDRELVRQTRFSDHADDGSSHRLTTADRTREMAQPAGAKQS